MHNTNEVKDRVLLKHLHDTAIVSVVLVVREDTLRFHVPTLAVGVAFAAAVVRRRRWLRWWPWTCPFVSPARCMAGSVCVDVRHVVSVNVVSTLDVLANDRNSALLHAAREAVLKQAAGPQALAPHSPIAPGAAAPGRLMN